ncbi:hypothetical protein [Microbacterium sp. LWH3-1.2]|jgi:hypothetical protein|uniref:hypothetical protein n=1 Tax=Microbacterium sp. LWH3-1.2 TaxID=3135256 RepID=UPI00343A1D1E
MSPDDFTQLRPGAYVRTSEWDAVFAEERLRARARAVARRATAPGAAFCRMTAVACHRLPVYRWRFDRVDMICARPHTRRNARDVIRHQEPLPEQDVVLIDGLRVTSLDRTVYDVIRTASMETALVVYDAALRKCAWNEATRSYDEARAAGFRALVDTRIVRGAGARGIRQARLLSAIGDGRAQLPGETITRLWLLQLGVAKPELQHRIGFPDGAFALLDLAWPALGRWVEFDGAFKLTDEDVMGGRTADDVRADQQSREDRVRRLTGWRCDRHGFERMLSIDAFAEYLRSIGLL